MAALGVSWHVPSQEEENFVFQLLSRLLYPELQRIKAHVSGGQPMSRCPFVFSIRSNNHTRVQSKKTSACFLLEIDYPHPEKHLFSIFILMKTFFFSTSSVETLIFPIECVICLSGRSCCRVLLLCNIAFLELEACCPLWMDHM